MSKSNQATGSRSRGGGFPLIVAPLLTDRKVAALLSGAAVIIVLLQMTGIAGWQCPVRSTFGQPCPGCGMTRAIIALLSGHWQVAHQLHPLASAAASTIAALASAALLPVAIGSKIAAAIASVESRSGFSTLMIAAAIIHWIGRLVGFW